MILKCEHCLPILNAFASSISSCIENVKVPLGVASLSGSLAITWNTGDATVAFYNFKQRFLMKILNFSFLLKNTSVMFAI